MDANIYSPPEADVQPKVDSPALWNPNASGLWSVLLTPAFGSILLLKNWHALGDESKIRTGRIWLGVSALMALCQFALPLVPAVPQIIHMPVQLIYLIVWYFAWQKPQTTYVQARWGTRYRRRGWSIPLLLGIGCWITVLIVIELLAMRAAA